MTDRSSFDAWRVLRIVSEFVNGFETMTDIGPSVSIFGSSQTKPGHPYYELATKVAEKIAEKGFAILTGGGPGIMEAANIGAQRAKGKSCGLVINLPSEVENQHIDPAYRLFFNYFFVRKVMFVRYAVAFIVLPGGYGTLDELFEAVTLIQTQKIRPFPIFLMGKEYWKGLVDWLRDVVVEKEKNLSAEHFAYITVTDDLDEVVNTIEKFSAAQGPIPSFELDKAVGHPGTT